MQITPLPPLTVKLLRMVFNFQLPSCKHRAVVHFFHLSPYGKHFGIFTLTSKHSSSKQKSSYTHSCKAVDLTYPVVSFSQEICKLIIACREFPYREF